MRKILLAVLVVAMFSGMSLAMMPATAEEPLLDCVTHKDPYNLHNQVKVICTNNNDVSVVTGIGIYIATTEGTAVYAPPVPDIGMIVQPGQSFVRRWDQTYENSPLGADGELVSGGDYVAHIWHGTPAHFAIIDRPL